MGSAAAAAPLGQKQQSEVEMASHAVVSGVTVYDPEQLLKFASAHSRAEDATVSAEKIAEAIELIYREDGYALAEVTLAYSQDGNPVLRVDEGQLKAVSITGLQPRTESRVRSYAEKLLVKTPLQLRDLERALMLSSDLAGVAIANQISPDSSGRGSVLAIHGAENTTSGAAGIEVVPIRPGSAVRGYVVQEFYGAITGGDMVRILGQATLDRGDDWSVSGMAYYRTPVGSNGTYIEAMGGNTVARRDFANITQDSRLTGWNAAFVIGHPIERSLTDFTYLLAEYEFVDARSRFLGQKLRSSTHALRLRALKGTDLADGSLFRAAATLSGGTRPDAVPGRLPDGAKSFAHFRSEIGLAVPLDKKQLTSLRVEFRGQWASTRLPEVERISMGHAPFLRGYAPAEVAGDRGYGATVEIARSAATGNGSVPAITPFAFGALGYTDIIKPRLGERTLNTVTSIGFGSSFHIKGGIHLSGWAAVPLRDGPQSRSGNPAFHASVTVGW
ncbi:ShlB/FhaC/HecB family hemolysin secretion/activation protein [Sphingorhabdus pulchriflava]|uniref:ShlB/FhaC/HecB family hemolysin secretion/activation protein n=2 Tax=Sphingorhabdus pulchriflava TaxID=2292257 RepID=A0A371BJ61_9SPHN|nr:ShlB/FhaC/HecB family hemolysin secretion/activation protein [Sphingorhabdus pulchriflava]